jgi:hypothetical protein
MKSIQARFAQIGRLTPEHRIIAEVLDGYLSELLARVERLERVVDFRPKDIHRKNDD